MVVRLESAAPAAQVAGRPASVAVHDLPSRSQGGDAACPLSPTHHLDFVLRAASTSASCGGRRDRR